jgi:hypothetical protein
MEIHALNQFCTSVIVKYNTNGSFINNQHDNLPEFISLSGSKTITYLVSYLHINQSCAILCHQLCHQWLNLYKEAPGAQEPIPCRHVLKYFEKFMNCKAAMEPQIPSALQSHVLRSDWFA